MSVGNAENAHTGIERAFLDALSGDTLASALRFAAFLRENGMVAGGPNGEIVYKDRCVAYMYLDSNAQKPGPWTIWSDGDYSAECEALPMDAPMKAIAWANVNFCGDCGGGCNPGKRKLIFGKAFENVCNADMAFHCPDDETLECVKKLLAIRKHDIDNR